MTLFTEKSIKNNDTSYNKKKKKLVQQTKKNIAVPLKHLDQEMNKISNC